MADTYSPRIVVSLATYNECDNIQALVGEIHHYLPEADVLIIDDNSPDGTGQLADQLAQQDTQLTVIHREGKLGLGTAMLKAMNYAMDNNYDYYINMDADFSHSPRYLPDLVTGMDEHDVMIGSRYVSGGGVDNWSASRQAISKTVNVMVRLLMRIPAADTSGGLRCYRVEKLRETDLDGLVSAGYSFLQEVLYRCWKAGCRIGETPIIFEERKSGDSKASLKECARSISVVMYLGVKATFGRMAMKKA